MIESVNPALGVAAVPIVDTVFSSPLTPFVAGVAGGAVVAGLVFAIASRPSDSREIEAARKAAELEAASRATASKATAEPLAGPAKAQAVTRKPRFSEAPREKSQAAVSVYRPRHMSAEQFERTGNIRVRSVEPSAEKAAAAYAASNHGTDDYLDIAENYVRQLTFRERMARRAQGVAAALGESLGIDMMEGVPVIQRADGSVGDVGTTWWEQAVGVDAITRGARLSALADLSIPDVPSISDDESYASRILANAASISGSFQPEARPVTSAERTSASKR